MRSGVVCLAVAAGVASAACDVKVGEQGISLDATPHGRAEEEWTRSYTLPKGGRLEIVSAGGPVSVAAGGPDIQFKVLRRSQAPNDEAARQTLKEETISEEVAADRVHVESKRSATANSGRYRVQTEWHVSIPAGLNVSVKGENADITLTDVDGTFVLENTNGGFRATGVSGPIVATTVNGIIDLDFHELTGDVTATTINGMVRVGVPAGANARLEARTVNGGVVVDENMPFTPSERERLRVTGQFGKGGPLLTLNTTNGPVRVRPAGVHVRRRSGEPVVVERRLEGRN